MENNTHTTREITWSLMVAVFALMLLAGLLLLSLLFWADMRLDKPTELVG